MNATASTASSAQAAPADKVNETITPEAPAKAAAKVVATPWYKKPAAKYAAYGVGIVAAGAAAYFGFKHFGPSVDAVIPESLPTAE